MSDDGCFASWIAATKSPSFSSLIDRVWDDASRRVPALSLALFLGATSLWSSSSSSADDDSVLRGRMGEALRGERRKVCDREARNEGRMIGARKSSISYSRMKLFSNGADSPVKLTRRFRPFLPKPLRF